MKYTNRLFPLIIFLLFLLHAYSQSGEELLRGRIVNAISREPVINAYVLIHGNQNYVAVSDSAGQYRISVFPGAYAVIVQHINYKNFSRQNILVSQGRQEVQDFELTEAAVSLDTIAIEAEDPVNSFGLDTRNNQRMAGVFYDPARVINANGAVVNVDDQANNVSVHGTSPNYVQWKIEGVEVVNPNHLENAGMMNDRPGYNGGGVSMISNQLMQHSSFYFAPFSPENGNALSGIFDVRLRRGNEERKQYTVQASLLGTDLSMEGPFVKNKKASYLLNCRYSTVGFLTMAGINFGDEKISFMDISWQLSFPYKKGALRFFGTAGSSSNFFDGKSDTAEVQIQKELQDISYKSQTIITGLNFTHSVSENLFLKSVVAYSVKNTFRFSEPTIPEVFNTSDQDDYAQQKISSVTYLTRKINSKLSAKAGSYVNYFKTDVFSRVDSLVTFNSSLGEMIFQPFISAEASLSEKFQVEGGVHALFLPRIGYFNLQPRLQATYKYSSGNSLTLNYGSSAQIQPGYILLSHNENRELLPTGSQIVSLNNHLKINSVKFKTVIYYQIFKNVPFTELGFSAFNYFNGTVPFSLKPDGTANSYGVDLTIERQVKDFYLSLSSGICNSSYIINRISYSSHFNSGINLAFTGGNEFVLKNKRKSIGVHLRAFARKGFYENSFDSLNSVSRLGDYYRVDFRVSYKKERMSSSYVWAIDIQNVSNARNVVYHYYDNFTGRIEPRYQLGLIPVLSFKIHF